MICSVLNNKLLTSAILMSVNTGTCFTHKGICCLNVFLKIF